MIDNFMLIIMNVGSVAGILVILYITYSVEVVLGVQWKAAYLIVLLFVISLAIFLVMVG